MSGMHSLDSIQRQYYVVEQVPLTGLDAIIPTPCQA
jgi:hypothetical protein